METSPSHRIEELLVHSAWLRRLASSLVAPDSEVEDLVQETWLAALVRGPARHEEGRAWLARVLRNKATSRARALGARRHRERESASAEGLPSAADLASRADMSRRLVELVMELPPGPQRILLARYFEGLSSAEIARRLGRPTGSVRSQLKRGLDELRTRLDAENEGERERWLSALTPLALVPRKGLSLKTALAASGLRAAVVGIGLLLVAAGVWWASRGPGGGAHAATAVVEERSELAELEAVEVAVDEDAGSVPTPTRVVVADEPAIHRSVIEGRVVHPETGEPVVWFALGIVPRDLAELFDVQLSSDTRMPEPEELELVRTDEAGHFFSSSKYASGEYAIVPVEDWQVAHPRMEPFRIRQPRAPIAIEHDATSTESHALELETGAVYAIDCPKALELGAESMVAIYSHIDHFPPGYFRPSPLQLDPVPFVRMRTDVAPTHRKRAKYLRLVSVDGIWSGSIPMEIPDSIATQFVSFDLEARALVEVDLDFGERDPPFTLELQVWSGAVDPTAEGAPEPDIVEIQAKFDGTKLEQAIVKYVPPGLATIAIVATTSETWFEVVELSAGRNSLKAVVLPHPDATGRIEGRVVHMGQGRPEPIVRAIVNGTLNGQVTFQTQDLEFQQQGVTWVAEFAFTHLPVSPHTIFFDKGGPATNAPKTFAVEPNRQRIEVNGPPVEFELHTDLTRTRLRVKAMDAVTGDKIRDFAVSVFVPGAWLRSRRADAKAGRATLKLIGELEGGMASLAAKGYIRRDVLLSEATKKSQGLELELELTPGWGGPVYVREKDTERPLAEVRILLDGVQVGVTDEAGQFQLEVPEAPQRVDFELAGFEVVSQGGWIDSEGEVIPVGLDPILQYIGVRMRAEE